MNFLKAIQAMKQGKELTRQEWNNQIIFHEDKFKWYSKKGDRVYFDIEDIEATDWKVVEEKKILSDKRIKDPLRASEIYLHVDDVREALREYIEWLYKTPYRYLNYRIIDEKAAEIFGKELVE